MNLSQREASTEGFGTERIVRMKSPQKAGFFVGAIRNGCTAKSQAKCAVSYVEVIFEQAKNRLRISPDFFPSPVREQLVVLQQLCFVIANPNGQHPAAFLLLADDDVFGCGLLQNDV